MRPVAISPGAAQSALPGLRVHRRLRAVARTDAQHRLRETISSADYGDLPGGGAKRLARATGSSPSASGSPDKASAAIREPYPMRPVASSPGAAQSALPGLRVHRRLRAVARTDAQHRLREIISNAPCGELPGGGAKRLARATGSSPSASGSPDRCAASPPGNHIQCALW
ncbi:hypothetical protein Km24235_2652 [Klebsiella michiganensis]|nr:hypothetical protein Km24235_2652 [Klebsiella michiganensis]